VDRLAALCPLWTDASADSGHGGVLTGGGAAERGAHGELD
jgi:hypothetical protein